SNRFIAVTDRTAPSSAMRPGFRLGLEASVNLRARRGAPCKPGKRSFADRFHDPSGLVTAIGLPDGGRRDVERCRPCRAGITEKMVRSPACGAHPEHAPDTPRVRMDRDAARTVPARD